MGTNFDDKRIREIEKRLDSGGVGGLFKGCVDHSDYKYVRIGSNGYTNISDYKPNIPDGTTILLCQILDVSGSGSSFVYNVSPDGKYLMGAGGSTVDVKIRYYYG